MGSFKFRKRKYFVDFYYMDAKTVNFSQLIKAEFIFKF